MHVYVLVHAPTKARYTLATFGLQSRPCRRQSTLLPVCTRLYSALVGLSLIIESVNDISIFFIYVQVNCVIVPGIIKVIIAVGM